MMYDEGKGVVQDARQALDWYRKSAEQGFAPAQYSLGMMYLQGRGTEQDNGQAKIWLEKAAEQGDADAQRVLQEINRSER